MRIPAALAALLATIVAPSGTWSFADDFDARLPAELRDSLRDQPWGRAAAGGAPPRVLKNEKVRDLEEGLDLEIDFSVNAVTDYANEEAIGVSPADRQRLVRGYFERMLDPRLSFGVRLFGAGTSGTLVIHGYPGTTNDSYVRVRFGPGPSVEGTVAIDLSPLDTLLGKTHRIPINGDSYRRLDLRFEDARRTFANDSHIRVRGVIEPEGDALPWEARVESAGSESDGLAAGILQKETLNWRTRGTLVLSEESRGPSLAELLKAADVSVGPLSISGEGVKLKLGPAQLSGEGVTLKLGGESLEYKLPVLTFERPRERATPSGGVAVQLDYQVASVSDGAPVAQRLYTLVSAVGTHPDERRVDMSPGCRQSLRPVPGKTMGVSVMQAGKATFPGAPAYCVQDVLQAEYIQDLHPKRSAILVNRLAHLRVAVDLELRARDLRRTADSMPANPTVATLSFALWPSPTSPQGGE
ncbi:MAG: hypothetical protein HY553_07170 [Elusimicrobia bacterium]|nr:hypothetical protein [Elusimicrobiota bacterium]